MVNRGGPADIGQRFALAVRDRHQRHLREHAVDRGELGQIEAAVQGGDERHVLAGEHRVRPIIDVEVQHVEPVGALAHILDHQGVGGDPVADVRIEPQRTRPGRVQFGRGGGVAGSEQSDVVPHLHQGFGERIHDTLAAAVKLRRHGLEQGRNLGDTHGQWALSSGLAPPAGPGCIEGRLRGQDGKNAAGETRVSRRQAATRRGGSGAHKGQRSRSPSAARSSAVRNGGERRHGRARRSGRTPPPPPPHRRPHSR